MLMMVVFQGGGALGGGRRSAATWGGEEENKGGGMGMKGVCENEGGEWENNRVGLIYIPYRYIPHI